MDVTDNVHGCYRELLYPYMRSIGAHWCCAYLVSVSLVTEGGGR